MDTVSVNKFRDTLKDCVEKVISQHNPLKVTRRNGKDFVVVSAEDWEQEQETLHVLQNNNLMSQVSNSMATHTQKQGYSPTDEEINEILSV
ncbi:type II toxin-antitoxin system prevent-host-death family antitoxin [Synechococcales cyanobacterium C]|uniref:Antitoxin n=1 Tax=Petrachloros mirabilis ULC683 TaxID=2781853 RepID=A0A8K1ZYN4_9CYAN|nr:type II toxin-antitoxin system Phd/YefM family antitoxin [Petrachloros mirabilis]NCJ06368.1 type II toxin-antitoxin system prevent-host-death family antitoxin [Petrachloros mirabilis ULC683]